MFKAPIKMLHPLLTATQERQLHRHREHRRDPVLRHRSGALQRSRMAELQGEQEQRGVHRPHLRHQGAVLPAGDRGAEDLREAHPGLRAEPGAVRAGDAGDAGALHRAVAPAQARELDPVRQDAGLRRRKPEGIRPEGTQRPGIQGRRRRRRGHGRRLDALRLQGACGDVQPRHPGGRRPTRST